MNILKLKGKLVERGMNVEKLASKVRMDRSTLYRKLNNGENFTVGEVKRIKNALKLDIEEANEIFFDQ